jgi:hypothetical protein
MSKPDPSVHRDHAFGAGLLIWFFATTMPLVNRDVTVFDDLDERLFHLPSIQRFASQLPSPDLSDYPSATTPLYHLAMSLVAAVVGDEVGILRSVNLLISAGALAAAWWVLSQVGSRASAAVFGLAIAASPYFIGPSVRLSTDNAALLSVFIAVGLMLPGKEQPIKAGWAATAAVLTRQLHAWLIGVMLWRAFRDRAQRSRWIAMSALPVVGLSAFVIMWGALTPPSFARGHSAALNIDTLVFKLTVFGMYGFFVFPWLVPVIRQHARRMGIAVGATLLLLAVIHLPWQDDPNRWGGAIWQLAARTPTLLDVPLSFWLLAPIGAVVVTAIASSGPTGRYMALCVLLWTIGGLASARAYQKYSDPMVLFVLGVAAQSLPRPPRWAWAGPAMLIAGLWTVDWMRFYA